MWGAVRLTVDTCQWYLTPGRHRVLTTASSNYGFSLSHWRYVVRVTCCVPAAQHGAGAAACARLKAVQ
jgi:hypothetical protein